MYRDLGFARLAPIALLVLTHLIPAHGQSVLGSSTAARCVENAPNGALACGSGATASPGTGATAIGINAKGTADAAMGFGFNANASAIAAMAFGKDASATNQGSVAVGQGASSTGSASTGIGFAARALANDTVAVGDTATASGNFSTAVGANSSASQPSSLALGNGAQATAANQMMFGTATNILAAPGMVSAASKAAQQGKVLMVTIDEHGKSRDRGHPGLPLPGDREAAGHQAEALAHDPEKCVAVFRKDHAQTRIWSAESDRALEPFCLPRRCSHPI